MKQLTPGWLTPSIAVENSANGPSSSPTSGVLSRPLFHTESGPGYWVNENSGVELVLPDEGGITFRVTRLSPTALWLSTPVPVNLPARRPTTVSLRRGTDTIGPMRGQLVYLDATSDMSRGPCVGFRLIGISIERGQQMLALVGALSREGLVEPVTQPPSVEEELTEPARINAIVRALASVGNDGLLGDPRTRVAIRLDRIDPGTGKVEWTTDVPYSWGEGPYVVDVVGYNSVYRLFLPSVALVEGRTLSPMPTTIQRVRHRFFRRTAVQSPMIAQFRHPVWRDIPENPHEVRDVSYGGLCFTIIPEEDLIFPGLVIPFLVVDAGDGDPVCLRGQVRSVVPSAGDEEAFCGISVTAYSSEDEAKWIRLVSRLLYGTTQTSENMTQPLWSMFEESGYFKLAGKTTEEFLELKRCFFDVGERATQSPQILCQVVWPSERGVEGSGSFLKAYESAWMGHQLAKRPGTSPEGIKEAGLILRDIYLRVFEHPQTDPNFRWAICYVEPTVPWIARTHLEFAERHAESGDAMCVSLRMMNVRCEESTGLVVPGVEIGRATAQEKAILIDLIRETHPHCYAEALDFVPGRIDLDEVADLWQQSGFERRREILVARRDGDPIAVMVMETGEVGTNLFRLLDATRLFSLADDAASVYPALMDEARRWYRARGRSSFLYLREDQDTSYVEAAKLHDISDPSLWIISARLVPDFLEHICETTSPRNPLAYKGE